MPYITRTNADALIPVETSREILKEVPTASKLLPLMRRLPNMTAKQRTIPVTSALANAYFLNPGTPTEGTDPDITKKQTTNAAWDKVTITAEELAVIVPITEAVLDDADYDIWAEIRPQIVEALGIAIDQAILFGINKPDAWGAAIVPAATTANHTIAVGTNRDVASDIIGVGGLMALVENDGYRVNGFLADGSFAPYLRDLRATDGQPIYVPALNSGYSDTIVGRPIEYDNSGVFNPANVLMVAGDFSKAVYAIRQDVTYKVLDQACIDLGNGTTLNLAQQDMVALRVVMRLGYQLAKPVTRRAGANGFPFAVLTPAQTAGGSEETTGGEG